MTRHHIGYGRRNVRQGTDTNLAAYFRASCIHSRGRLLIVLTILRGCPRLAASDKQTSPQHFDERMAFPICLIAGDEPRTTSATTLKDVPSNSRPTALGRCRCGTETTRSFRAEAMDLPDAFSTPAHYFLIPISPLRLNFSQLDGAARPRSRSEGAIRATLTRTPSASSLLRSRPAVYPTSQQEGVATSTRRDEITWRVSFDMGVSAFCPFAARGFGNGALRLIGCCKLRKFPYWLGCRQTSKLTGADRRTVLRHFGGICDWGSHSHGGAVVRLLVFYISKLGSNPRRVTRSNRAGRCRLSAGFSRGSHISPRPCIPALLHAHHTSPSSVLKTSAGLQGRGITGDPRENPATSGIVRHDSHVRKSGSGPSWESNPVCLGKICTCKSTWAFPNALSRERERYEDLTSELADDARRQRGQMMTCIRNELLRPLKALDYLKKTINRLPKFVGLIANHSAYMAEYHTMCRQVDLMPSCTAQHSAISRLPSNSLPAVTREPGINVNATIPRSDWSTQSANRLSANRSSAHQFLLALIRALLTSAGNSVIMRRQPRSRGKSFAARMSSGLCGSNGREVRISSGRAGAREEAITMKQRDTPGKTRAGHRRCPSQRETFYLSIPAAPHRIDLHEGRRIRRVAEARWLCPVSVG
ncbi:hypothetical protein PR048_032321 [Dryococelus australis]|uniref:Uncharacterized protein n=1 Tax=Dryococelus australis TaxID=614101 RepID=A0ABQ9G2P9_9NEOP|nr:hypothetical protein PR048_032321 [Dryococelus australis]